MNDVTRVSELARAPAAPSAAASGFRARRYRAQDGLELYYRDYGDPDSRRLPVLCLPGLTRNSKDFHDLALHLAPTRRVLAPDYRGRGLSARDPDWRNYRPETYIGDILDLLAVADAPRVVAVGTSMGGLLSLGLAIFRPTCLAGVVLNDIGPDVNPVGYQRIIDYISVDRPQPDWAAAITYTKELFPNLSMETEAEWQDLAESTYRLGEDGLLHYDWDVALTKALTASQARFPDLCAVFRALEDRPALALRGALSDVLTEATFDKMAKVKPDLLRATIPNVGHVPALDEKEAILALDDFFARI
jgi:pimeloyl-ACP methyl ester carboxylesterase